MSAYSETAIGVMETFEKLVNADKRIASLYANAKANTATYAEANEFAAIMGDILHKSFAGTDLHLPEKLSYNDAKELLNPANNMFDAVVSYSHRVQESLNKKANIGVKAVRPPTSEKKKAMDRLVRKATESDAETFVENMKEPLVQHSLSASDSTLKANADFHKDLGFSPKIVREYEGKHWEHTRTVVNGHDYGNRYAELTDCEWCRSMAGTYDYDPKDSEVYGRHEGCRCKITYIPSKGSKREMSTSGNAFVRW